MYTVYWSNGSKKIFYSRRSNSSKIYNEYINTNIILHFIKIRNIENAVRQNKACIIAWRIWFKERNGNQVSYKVLQKKEEVEDF